MRRVAAVTEILSGRIDFVGVSLSDVGINLYSFDPKVAIHDAGCRARMIRARPLKNGAARNYFLLSCGRSVFHGHRPCRHEAAVLPRPRTRSSPRTRGLRAPRSALYQPRHLRCAVLAAARSTTRSAGASPVSCGCVPGAVSGARRSWHRPCRAVGGLPRRPGGIRSVCTLVPRRDAGPCDHRWCDRIPAARGDVPHLRADPLRDREAGPMDREPPTALRERVNIRLPPPSSQVD